MTNRDLFSRDRLPFPNCQDVWKETEDELMDLSFLFNSKKTTSSNGVFV